PASSEIVTNLTSYATFSQARLIGSRTEQPPAVFPWSSEQKKSFSKAIWAAIESPSAHSAKAFATSAISAPLACPSIQSWNESGTRDTPPLGIQWRLIRL